MKDWLEMVTCQALHTALNRRSDFTGRRIKISSARSSGISERVGLLFHRLNVVLFSLVMLRLRGALFVAARSIVIVVLGARVR
jgi:hypothetical protein